MKLTQNTRNFPRPEATRAHVSKPSIKTMTAIEDTHKSQDRILYSLKSRGPQTVKQLAEALKMTTMGIRQHLIQLEASGLITANAEEKQARGRPVKAWRLSENGHQSFPDSHAEVTLDLISGVKELLGESALDLLIARRTEITRKHYLSRLKAHKDLESKVKTLVELRNEEGYMADYSRLEPGGYLLMENHCPICAAAKSCQGFCQSELEIFQSLFGKNVRVTRAEHLLLNARRCTYEIVPIR